jgi:hypothetical protein
MADREIRYDTDAGAFLVGDELRIAVPRPGEVVAPIEAVAEVSVASFERALSLYEEIAPEGSLNVWLSDVPLDEFDAELEFPRSRGHLTACAGEARKDGVRAQDQTSVSRAVPP